MAYERAFLFFDSFEALIVSSSYRPKGFQFFAGVYFVIYIFEKIQTEKRLSRIRIIKTMEVNEKLVELP